MRRRHVFAAFLTACAVTIGTALSLGRTAVSAETTSTRPLSKQSPVERFGQAALDAQSAFFQRMPGVEIRYGENGAVSRITGPTGLFLKSGLAGFKVGQPAQELLEKVGPALLAAGTEELRVISVASQAARADPVERQNSPERTVRTVQYIRGREVQMSSVNISLNTHTNQITLVVADFLPDRGLQHEPKLTAAQARAKVEAAMRDSELEEEQRIVFEDAPARLAYAFEDIGDSGGIGGVLVWVFHVSRAGESLEASVSALTGEVIRLRGLLVGFNPNRISYTANYTAPNPAFFPNGLTFTFGEGGAPPDQVAADAYDKAGIAFGVFDQAFGRNSWNGAGAPIQLVTHYATSPGNALYGPGGYLIFADGSPSAAGDVDAVSHEFTHAIVHSQTGIVDPNGPVDGAPALNEAFGDWGATVSDVHLNLGFVSPATWSIGQQGLRNWQIPTLGGVQFRDWYPSRTFILDSASRYYNSTIAGHAFYLLSSGGQHYRAGLPGSGVPVIPVTGLGYQSARNIFYNSLATGLLSPTASFLTLRDATVAAAPPVQQNSVRQAWDAVGVGHNCTTAPQTPQLQVWPYYCRGLYDLSWATVAGATRYDGQAARANLGWAFAATIVDADTTTCHQNLPNATWMVRLRACNGCGCSAWSNTEYLQYWSPCQ